MGKIWFQLMLFLLFFLSLYLPQGRYNMSLSPANSSACGNAWLTYGFLFSSYFSLVNLGPSGTYSSNSPASPLSSASLTSPLSPFSLVSGSQSSPTKQGSNEVSGSILAWVQRMQQEGRRQVLVCAQDALFSTSVFEIIIPPVGGNRDLFLTWASAATVSFSAELHRAVRSQPWRLWDCLN